MNRRLVIVLLFTCLFQTCGSQTTSLPAAQTPARTIGDPTQQNPKYIAGGFDLPNGWRITPAGKAIATIEDLVLNAVVSPDGKIIVATHSGYLPHGIDVIDVKTRKLVQQIPLKTTWLGLAWSSDGHTLYVSGGNATGAKNIAGSMAPIYEFTYKDGLLSEKPTGGLVETIDAKKVWWSGVAYLPGKHLIYAANRGTGTAPSNVVVFDADTRQIVTRIPVEINPYATVLSKDGRRLFVSNWASESVSVIDTGTNKVIRTLHVGMNPNDMKLAADGRLFVVCSNDNTIHVIDTNTLEVVERLSTTLSPFAPEGSTPDAIEIDNKRKILYVANADNNSIAVIRIAVRGHSAVIGFIPTGWYPSALALAENNNTLFIGNSKGEEGHPDLKGVGSPLASKWNGDETVKTLQKSSIEVLPVADLRQSLPKWTHEVIENTPYNDSLLSEARPSKEPTILPREVGVETPIKHVIYIIKENRTYDQEFGDLKGANGDPRLTIFGEEVTPNQHALAKQYVILDNLYCDGEVSVDGHSWSDSAYATDFNERYWPPTYAGRSNAVPTRAYIPSAGHLWDLAARKGLTYRSYGEYAARASTGTTMDAAPGAGGLVGHVAADYLGSRQRDTANVAVFLKEFKEYEKNYDSSDPNKQFPNFVVMSMPEDHTRGTAPGAFTPRAMVASNDYAIGQLVDAVSHSRYWPNTAIFIIEDDGQDGPDHVDARRTVGLVLSPYVKRGIVDSTLYSTSSMVRSIELLLGMPPMSQYDAAAMPMYASFGTEAQVTPFDVIQPEIDVNAKNKNGDYGSDESRKMDFSDVDRAPMHALNEIIWKSVKGANSPMPPPVHRFRPLIDAGDMITKDDD
ncbi:beta-propeller fold lactonase family protein [Terracidiphilus sp.]|uniref:bifunctional YncE family protein/alkaline phosphatase family protein n=1 Tax=Terracidiphilus sp. TaxID=1964191 RepID=UPI003C19EEB5